MNHGTIKNSGIWRWCWASFLRDLERVNHCIYSGELFGLYGHGKWSLFLNQKHFSSKTRCAIHMMNQSSLLSQNSQQTMSEKNEHLKSNKHNNYTLTSQICQRWKPHSGDQLEMRGIISLKIQWKLSHRLKKPIIK